MVKGIANILVCNTLYPLFGYLLPKREKYLSSLALAGFSKQAESQAL